MTAAWCSRCRRAAPIDSDEVIGDGGGDPAALTILSPPDGWIGDPDDADGGLVCGDCATPGEITQWMADLALIEDEYANEG